MLSNILISLLLCSMVTMGGALTQIVNYGAQDMYLTRRIYTKEEIKLLMEKAREFRTQFINKHGISHRNFRRLVENIKTYILEKKPHIKYDLTEYSNKWKYLGDYSYISDIYTYRICELNSYNYEERNSNANANGESVDNYKEIVLGVDHTLGENYEKYLELFNKVYSMCDVLYQRDDYYDDDMPYLVSKDDYEALNFDEIAKSNLPELYVARHLECTSLYKTQLEDYETYWSDRHTSKLAEFGISEEELSEFRGFHEYL